MTFIDLPSAKKTSEGSVVSHLGDSQHWAGGMPETRQIARSTAIKPLVLLTADA
jgi:hypothetical protein